MVWDGLRSFNSTQHYFSWLSVQHLEGKKGLFYRSFSRRSCVRDGFSAWIICRLHRREEPILGPRNIFLLVQIIPNHHPASSSSAFFFHWRSWFFAGDQRAPGSHVFGLSNNSSQTTFFASALSLYRHSVCLWPEHVSIFARWLQLLCLVFVIYGEWMERVKKTDSGWSKSNKKR